MSENLPSVGESYADLEQPYDWQNVPRYRGGNRVTRNKLNPVTPKARRVASALKMPMTRSAGGARLPKSAATSGDSGYWNMIVGACFLLFLLYIVAHNEVQTWANILFWSPAPPVQVGSPLTPGSAASAAAAGPPAIGAPLVNPVSNTLGALQGLGFFPSQFQGITPQSGMLGAIIGAPIPAGTSTTPPVTGAATGGFQSTPLGSMLKRWGIIK
jgi:hypothetical protein